MDIFVPGSGRTTAQFTSAGVYEFTTFGDTTVEMEVGSIGGFLGSPSSAPSTQTRDGTRASNHERQHSGLEVGCYNPPTASFTHESIHRKFDEACGEDDGRS